MKNRLTIAVQKKGRLFEQSIDLKSLVLISQLKVIIYWQNLIIYHCSFVRSDDIPSLVSNGY